MLYAVYVCRVRSRAVLAFSIGRSDARTQPRNLRSILCRVSTPRAEFQPELWVDDAPAAVFFYRRAFGAHIDYRLDGPGDDDVIAQMSIAGAQFWLSSASDDLRRFSPNAIGGATGRVLLVVDDPESLVRGAVAAGATLTSPVGDEHGWRLGRLVDPFGHEWEIGHPIGVWPPPPPV